jgi:MgtC family
MGTLDIALRLSAATLVGVLLGLNRDLHGKSTGVRTLGVLCLGSALAVLSIHAVTGGDESRVIQGIVTGRRLSRGGRDCPKRERPSRPRTHHGRLRVGYRMSRRCLRGRAVADCGCERCSCLHHSRAGRAF